MLGVRIIEGKPCTTGAQLLTITARKPRSRFAAKPSTWLRSVVKVTLPTFGMPLAKSTASPLKRLGMRSSVAEIAIHIYEVMRSPGTSLWRRGQHYQRAPALRKCMA
jgi:hypothetical protein